MFGPVPERTYDIVAFGATGFTGGLTAEYLAAHAPEGTRWAVAGRSESRLRSIVERLAGSPRPPPASWSPTWATKRACAGWRRRPAS
ncbi:MAG: saccharopine dehydrogenase NADP-binding domain-containing protein [Sandaracinaceae bacterium]|nr:saccharopine dehydrogenase NADP-binding domain-containing protein [Sandaracinaceae bacterium]